MQAYSLDLRQKILETYEQKKISRLAISQTISSFFKFYSPLSVITNVVLLKFLQKSTLISKKIIYLINTFANLEGRMNNALTSNPSFCLRLAETVKSKNYFGKTRKAFYIYSLPDNGLSIRTIFKAKCLYIGNVAISTKNITIFKFGEGIVNRIVFIIGQFFKQSNHISILLRGKK